MPKETVIQLRIDIPRSRLTETLGVKLTNLRKQPEKSMQIESSYKQNPPLRHIKKDPEVTGLCDTLHQKNKKFQTKQAIL